MVQLPELLEFLQLLDHECGGMLCAELEPVYLCPSIDTSPQAATHQQAPAGPRGFLELASIRPLFRVEFPSLLPLALAALLP